jgi:hypothetical protein
MAEETKQGTEEQRPNDVQQEAKSKGDDTVEIRKGELAGYKTQLREMKKQLEELSAMKSAEEEAKLKAAQNWEALEKQKAKEIEALKADLESTRRSALTERARSALLGAGMSAGLAVEGAISTMPKEIESDGIRAWVDALKAAHPAEFARPVNQIGAPSAGPTGRPTTDEAGALKAAVAAARGKGEKAMGKAMADVRAYIARGNKNPLA